MFSVQPLFCLRITSAVSSLVGSTRSRTSQSRPTQMRHDHAQMFKISLVDQPVGNRLRKCVCLQEYHFKDARTPAIGEPQSWAEGNLNEASFQRRPIAAGCRRQSRNIRAGGEECSPAVGSDRRLCRHTRPIDRGGPRGVLRLCNRGCASRRPRRAFTGTTSGR